MLAILSVSVWCVAQGVPKSEPSKSVALTKEEKTEYDLNQAKIDNLNLRVQLIQSQISQQQQQLTQESRMLVERFAKAHALDPEKWFLDANKGEFRAVEVAKPEPPKDAKK